MAIRHSLARAAGALRSSASAHCLPAGRAVYDSAAVASLSQPRLAIRGGSERTSTCCSRPAAAHLAARPCRQSTHARQFSTTSTSRSLSSALDDAAPLSPESVALNVARRSNSNPSQDAVARVVLLTGLPITATPTDISRLSPDRRDPQIDRVEFLRSHFFGQSGKALVYFPNEKQAQRFAVACSKRILANKVLDARAFTASSAYHFHLEYYSRHPRHLQLPLDLIDYEAGSLVFLQGLPILTTEEKMTTKLSRHYELKEAGWWRGKRRSNAGVHPNSLRSGARERQSTHKVLLGPVLRLRSPSDDSSTASFLVRLKTPNDAMTLVRRWHNTYFTPRRFNIDDTAGTYRIQANVVF